MSYRRPQRASPNAQLDLLVRQQQRHHNNFDYSPSVHEFNEFSWDAIADEKKEEQEPPNHPATPTTNVFACANPLLKGRHKKQHQPTRTKPKRTTRLFRSQTAPPHSPAHSSSTSTSGGFVGWPGTQDRHGHTILADDGSAGSLVSLRNKEQHELSRWTAQTSASTTLDSFEEESFLLSSSPLQTSREESFLSASLSPIAKQPDDDDTYGDPDLSLPFGESFDNSDVQLREAEEEEEVSLSAFRYRDLQRPVVRSRHERVPQATPSRQSVERVQSAPKQQPQSRQIVERVRSAPTRHSAKVSQNLPRVRSEPPDRRAPFRSLQDNDPETDALCQPVPLQRSPASLQTPHRQTFNRRQSRDAVAAAAQALGKDMPLTAETLHSNANRYSKYTNFASPTSRGFAGLLHKTTQDVPCLVDNLLDSDSSSKATSVVSGSPNNNKRASLDSVSDIFDGLTTSNESDVFDNLSFGGNNNNRSRQQQQQQHNYPARIAEEADDDSQFQLVHLPGGLTAIATTPESFRNRDTASDFDTHLTNSDVSSNGYTTVPTVQEMLASGTSYDSSLRGIHGNIGSNSNVQQKSSTVSRSVDEHTDTSCSSSLFSDPYRGEEAADRVGDLSAYHVEPHDMKKVIKAYRRFSQRPHDSFHDMEKEEDESKAFALFEMRSRIMEKDIERGLERRGGTTYVDDLATTEYYRKAHRIRDAVIVSKAWRDGATISDICNSAVLTRRSERSYFIRRPIVQIQGRRKSYRYTWEAVKWLDDTDMLQYRCTSLGSRHMRGFEMFTIGDCQSILLKLTNERCVELRKELNTATARQLKAEELLKNEVDHGDGMMTDAEMAYLAAMEVVKTISKELVIAERSHALVRERIEKLISRYESLLQKIETESFAGASSVVTNDSSFYSEFTASEVLEREEQMWARRARRAEIEAEIAARETLIESHQSRRVREEKRREVETLHEKLDDLQSESTAPTEQDRFHVAQGLGVHKSVVAGPTNRTAPSLASSASRMSKEKLDGVKKRFRDRIASRNPQRLVARPAPTQRAPRNRPSSLSQVDREILRSAGEEMMQQMDFYERSLQAVNRR